MKREEMVVLAKLRQTVREQAVEIEVLQGRVDLYARTAARLKRRCQAAQDKLRDAEDIAETAERYREQRDIARSSLTKNAEAWANERDGIVREHAAEIRKLVEQGAAAARKQGEEYQRLIASSTGDAPRLALALDQVRQQALAFIGSEAQQHTGLNVLVDKGVAAMRAIANRCSMALDGGPFAKKEQGDATKLG